MDVTPEQLATILATVQGSTRAVVFAATVPGMRKHNADHQPNPWWREDDGWQIVKQTTFRVPVIGLKSQRGGTAYERQVRNARHRNGSPLDKDGAVQQFHSANMRWGRIVLTTDHRRLPLKYHETGSKSRRPIQLAEALEGYRDGTGRLYLDAARDSMLFCRYVDPAGNVIPNDEVEPWLYRSDAADQADLVRRGIFVRWRNYAIEHIVHVRMFGQQYDVIAPDPAAAATSGGTADKPLTDSVPAFVNRLNNARRRLGLNPIGGPKNSPTRRELIDRLVGKDKARGRKPHQRQHALPGTSQ